MKRFFLAAIPLIATATTPDPAEFKKLPLFSQPSISINRVYDAGELYILRGAVHEDGQDNLFSAYVTKDKSIAVFGEAFFTKTMQPLRMPITMANHEKEAAFVYGSGPVKLYLFTDPECPFCKKMELSMPKFANKATFFVYLFPLSHHPNAKKMSQWILSLPPEKRVQGLMDVAADKHGGWQELKITPDLEKQSRVHLDAARKLADELGLDGTPALYDKEGRPINWTTLEEYLKH
ncbi:MAG: thioredoxin fold domain-containing protein [Campylobacterales bacterium]